MRFCVVRAVATLLIAAAHITAWAANNKPPAVSLTSPTSGATFAAPATITLTASASDPDGTVTRVDFYQGTTLIGTKTVAPFSMTWSNVAGGSYSLTAQATDNIGAAKTSSAVSITVSGARILIAAPTSGAMVYGGSVVVSGTFFGDPSTSTILVDNGTTSRLATISGNAYSAILPVYTGANTLRAVVTRRDKTSDSATTSIVGNSNPLIVFASPTTKTFDAPADIPFAADALSPTGTIAKVDFFRNGSLVGTASAPPYQYSWNGATAGTHTIGATATDANGYAGTVSLPITINGPNLPPTVSLTSPANGAAFTAPATIPMTAAASDADGYVTRVEFLQNGAVVGSTNVSPYAASVSNVPVGSYTLTARATDNRSGVTTSAPRSITVSSANAPPTVSLTSPAAGTAYVAPATIALSANAADSDGTVAKVDFYQGTTLIGTATSAPYTATWANVASGNYNLTAKATDNQGATTASTAVGITVSANTPPTVTLTSPAAASTFTAPATVSLAATATDSDGTVARVDFYQGTTLIGTATSAPYSASWTNVAAGNYTLTAKATDNRGAATTSAGVGITVSLNNPPAVSLTSPAAGSRYNAPATIALAATASDTDGAIARVDFYQGSTVIGSASAVPYAATWSNVAAGSYLLTAKAIDNGGAATTSASVSVTVDAFGVTITAPTDGATIASEVVNVSGTLQGPANAGVTVNGSVAAIDGHGRFYANNVPLSIGSNTITATLGALDGTSTSQAITVSSTGPSPVSVAATPTHGLSPLVVTFTASAQPGVTIRKMEIDADGNGSIDQTLDAADWTAPITYTATGGPTINATIRITDDQGTVYNQTIPIVMGDPVRIDATVRAIWSGMTNALAAGDKATAMQNLSASAQLRYGPVFDVLLPSMPAIVGSFSSLQSVSLADAFGEYAINRTIDGENRIYLIYFTQDGDGVWRLSSM